MSDGGLTVSTAQFSLVSWAVSKLFKPVGDFLAAKVAGRTQQSRCDTAPAWASVDSNPSGSTHSCVRMGKALADGTPIAELEIKSNRGTYQWVQLPSTLRREYVWVENQPDLVRSSIRKLFGDPATILLAPGARMTIGYRQPASPTQLAFHTYVDDRSAALSMLRLMLEAVVDNGVDTIGGWLAVLTCSKTLDIDPTNLDNPLAVKWPNVFLAGTTCIYKTARDFADHPERAAEVAGELLGSGVDGSAVTSETQRLFKVGKFAKVIGEVLNLGTYVVKELTFITDALSAGIGATNATDVTLTLAADNGQPSTLDGSLTEALRAIDGEVPGLRGLSAAAPESATGDAAAATLYQNGKRSGTAVFVYGVASNTMNLLDWSTDNRAACDGRALWSYGQANDFGCTSTTQGIGPCPVELLSAFDAAAPIGTERRGDCTTYGDGRWASVSTRGGGAYWRNLTGRWEPATTDPPG